MFHPQRGDGEDELKRQPENPGCNNFEYPQPPGKRWHEIRGKGKHNLKVEADGCAGTGVGGAGGRVLDGRPEPRASLTLGGSEAGSSLSSTTPSARRRSPGTAVIYVCVYVLLVLSLAMAALSSLLSMTGSCLARGNVGK